MGGVKRSSCPKAAQSPTRRLSLPSKSQVGKARVIVRPPPEGPMIFPIGFVDRQIVDGSKASLHDTSQIEFPLLVPVGAEPVAAVVMPLIGEAHGDAIIGKTHISLIRR